MKLIILNKKNRIVDMLYVMTKIYARKKYFTLRLFDNQRWDRNSNCMISLRKMYLISLYFSQNIIYRPLIRILNKKLM